QTDAHSQKRRLAWHGIRSRRLRRGGCPSDLASDLGLGRTGLTRHQHGDADGSDRPYEVSAARTCGRVLHPIASLVKLDSCPVHTTLTHDSASGNAHRIAGSEPTVVKAVHLRATVYSYKRNSARVGRSTLKPNQLVRSDPNLSLRL